MKFNIFPLRESAILYLYSLRSSILIDPEYQRMGEIWTLDKKQLLIDSIINGFDIPKLYFHDLSFFDPRAKHDYAIIDGRQRLEAVWAFIDGSFPLADDFEFLRDPEIKAAGLTYRELALKHPQIKQRFDATSLSVVVVQSDDLDLIEEMFSRLNEAVPLNAAEKRNAFPGPLPKLVRDLTKSGFFTKNLRISNARYQHRDLAAKFIYLTHLGRISDTKKIYLDAFFEANSGAKESEFRGTLTATVSTLSVMQETFVSKDKLLGSTGMVVLYYLLFLESVREKQTAHPTRSVLLGFEERRAQNRRQAENDIASANYDLLEFDRLNQTPNDAFAMRFRLGTLSAYVTETLERESE